MKQKLEDKERMDDHGRVWKPVPGIPCLHYCFDRTLIDEEEIEEDSFGDVLVIILSLGVIGLVLLRWLQ